MPEKNKRYESQCLRCACFFFRGVVYKLITCCCIHSGQNEIPSSNIITVSKQLDIEQVHNSNEQQDNAKVQS